MLGNFSFGDYFKEQAIEHAWTLLTRDFALPKDKLLVTVYSEDEDAAALWRKVAGLPDYRIIRIPTSDNFWRMGDTGPCGPCSEIFYDHGDAIPGGPPGCPDEDGDRFIEIWNLVFMQYEEGPPGMRAPLPRPSIDTGMGLERFAAILQGVHDNYDTDTFRALILASRRGHGAGAGRPVPGQPPRGGRPPALGRLPDGRRRAALQRGARLRAAPDPAPRHAPRPSDGRGRALAAPAGAGAGAADGGRLPGAGARPGADRRDAAAGGDALPHPARPRPGPARRGNRAPGRGAGSAGRRGFPPVRHLRLPARPHAGRAARRRARGGRGGLHHRHGRAAPPCPRRLGRLRRGRHRDPVVRPARAASAPPSSSAIPPRWRRGRSWPSSRTARWWTTRRRAPRSRCCSTRSPFYAESGGQVGRYRRDLGRRERPRSWCATRRRSSATCFVHLGTVEGGEIRSRAGRAGRSGPRPRAAPSAPTTPRRTSCTRRCAAAWARTWRRRARSTRPTGCASTSSQPVPIDARRPGLGGGRGQRPHPPELRGHHAADDARRRGAGGRHGAVR